MMTTNTEELLRMVYEYGQHVVRTGNCGFAAEESFDNIRAALLAAEQREQELVDFVERIANHAAIDTVYAEELLANRTAAVSRVDKK